MSDLPVSDARMAGVLGLAAGVGTRSRPAATARSGRPSVALGDGADGHGRGARARDRGAHAVVGRRPAPCAAARPRVGHARRVGRFAAECPSHRGAAARHRDARGATPHPVEAGAADRGRVRPGPRAPRSGRRAAGRHPVPRAGRADHPRAPGAVGRQRATLAVSKGTAIPIGARDPRHRRLLHLAPEPAAVPRGALVRERLRHPQARGRAGVRSPARRDLPCRTARHRTRRADADGRCRDAGRDLPGRSARARCCSTSLRR